ncbi:MAG TPA: hypothetical protein VG273_06750 [Bryobacteraceae bacterium]|jgi:hypothetical protein|nr:hypothetical protein [Bryobacteraceae bacterium]
MVSRDEAARILRDEVSRKKAAYECANVQFNAIADTIPSGLPTPDGTDRILNAGKNYRFTMNAYDQALREYNNFIRTGVIPERLKQLSRPAATG